MKSKRSRNDDGENTGKNRVHCGRHLDELGALQQVLINSNTNQGHKFDYMVNTFCTDHDN